MRHKPKSQARGGDRGIRVADQIQRELAPLISRELRDPRVQLVTLISVEVTPDYAHATVYFSTLSEHADDVASALNEAAGYLRNFLFKRLTIHTVPSLHFRLDHTVARGVELSALIDEANRQRSTDD